MSGVQGADMLSGFKLTMGGKYLVVLENKEREKKQVVLKETQKEVIIRI